MPRTATRPGDSAQLLGLLWAPRQLVGRSGLTIAGLTAAAINLAEERGLHAVTMRAVAQAAGVGAMTLYTYVPGRSELVELMVDAAATQLYADGRLPADAGSWRAGIEQVAWSNWAHILRHRWLVDVPPARPVLGPGVTAKYDAELAPLDGIGLDDHDMDDLLTTVLGMVASAARWQVGLDRVREQSGMTDDEWWALAGPVLAATSGPRRFPLASRVGENVASAGNPEQSLRRGLGWLLDGIAHRLDQP